KPPWTSPMPACGSFGTSPKSTATLTSFTGPAATPPARWPASTAMRGWRNLPPACSPRPSAASSCAFTRSGARTPTPSARPTSTPQKAPGRAGKGVENARRPVLPLPPPRRLRHARNHVPHLLLLVRGGPGLRRSPRRCD
nr:hypothetical protein [Tanacetum cinerariifolium]